jgi:phosphatidylserine/phosphatidylglycerophosphate/cardiolipin synthase-like enzyme
VSQDTLLTDIILKLAQKLPKNSIEVLCSELQTLKEESEEARRKTLLLRSVPPTGRDLMNELLEIWFTSFRDISPRALSLAIRAVFIALYGNNKTQRFSPSATSTALPASSLPLSASGTAPSSPLTSEALSPKIDLIWSDPFLDQNRLFIPSDQALAEVIQQAQKWVLIVAFAPYQLTPIHKALQEAAQRGVYLNFILTTGEEKESKITCNALKAISPEVEKKTYVYHWPEANRPKSSKNKIGSLFAKCAVADKKIAFISCANLANYDFKLNMEMGVRIEGGPLPDQINTLFRTKIQQNVFVPVSI